MALRKLETSKFTDGLFGELFISTDNQTGLTRIGIYDSGFEIFDVDELIAVKSHLNSVIMKLKFPNPADGLPF